VSYAVILTNKPKLLANNFEIVQHEYGTVGEILLWLAEGRTCNKTAITLR